MGADPVREALTSDYVKRLIQVKSRQLRRRPEFGGAEILEIQQDLALHVLRRAHNYDPARGAVVTFIDRVVDSAAAMLCRERKRFKTGTGLCIQSLEGSELQAEGRPASLLDLLTPCDVRRHRGAAPNEERQAELAAEVPGILARMTPQQREIAIRLMGAGKKATARDLGFSWRRVHQATTVIRERLERAGFTEI
jgi:hypothetical protein